MWAIPTPIKINPNTNPFCDLLSSSIIFGYQIDDKCFLMMWSVVPRALHRITPDVKAPKKISTPPYRNRKSLSIIVADLFFQYEKVF